MLPHTLQPPFGVQCLTLRLGRSPSCVDIFLKRREFLFNFFVSFIFGGISLIKLKLNSGWRPRRKANAGPRRETVRCGATFNPLQFYKINPL